ncbi:hypothetical protein ACLOJK_037603 [Asimina triloba]
MVDLGLGPDRVAAQICWDVDRGGRRSEVYCEMGSLVLSVLTVVRPTLDPWKPTAIMAWTACRWSTLMKFSGSWRRWGLLSFCPDQIFRLELVGDGFHGWLVEKMEQISVLRLAM